MKKLFLLFVFVFFGIFSAQTNFGVKGGYNLSNMKWKFTNFNDEKFDSKSFFYVGFLAENHFNDKFSLQGEFIFTELGGKSAEERTRIVGTEVIYIGTATTKWTNTQIQVPISAKYYFVPNFSFSGGLNFGFTLSQKVKTDYIIDGQEVGDTDLFRKLTIFPFIGTEYQFKNKIFADLRYNFGLLNVAISGSPETRIGFLQAGIGYRFK